MPSSERNRSKRSLVSHVIHALLARPPQGPVEAMPTASLLLAWQLKGKRILIVGGGDVASGRLESVLVAEALVTLISPRRGLHPKTLNLLEQNPDRILYHDRDFSPIQDLEGVHMVLTAIDDTNASRYISNLARERRIPVNVADIPALCDFYFGSQIQRGNLQILISTNGQSPKLANIIKKQIEAHLPESVAKAIENVGVLRAKLRERAPGVGGDVGKRRMKWMIDVCNKWSLDDLALLDEDGIERMLNLGWENGTVISTSEAGIPASSRFKLPEYTLPAAVGFLAGSLVTCLVVTARLRG
jgi:precorrin-2 dehydrogenase/sirohydrochlorin ferrochelatase